MTPDEEALCQELRKLFDNYVERLGTHHTHRIFKGMTAAFGTRLRGKRGKTDPAKYQNSFEATRRRKYGRTEFERLINMRSGDLPKPW